MKLPAIDYHNASHMLLST